MTQATNDTVVDSWPAVGSPERPVFPPARKDWATKLLDAEGKPQGFCKDEDTARAILAKKPAGWTFRYAPGEKKVRS